MDISELTTPRKDLTSPVPLILVFQLGAQGKLFSNERRLYLKMFEYAFYNEIS